MQQWATLRSSWCRARALQAGSRTTPSRAAGLVAWLCAALVALSFAYHHVDQHVPALFASAPETAERVLVDKSERTLLLVRDNRLLATYRVALGGNPKAHKEVRGDSRTPEGRYTIDHRLTDSAFHRALHISYPERRDREFAAAIRRSPGGAVMIHGQPNDLGWLERLRRPRDWTDGCIAVSNRAIEEIWQAVPDGTPITIRP